MAKNEKDLVKQEEGGVPANYNYGDDAGTGFEGTTGDDLSIPFLGILQSNSPQVEDDSPEGSKAGMLYNTVTRELFESDEGVVLIPVHKEHVYVEWVPRNSGGGFVGMYAPDSPEVKAAIEHNDGRRFGKLELANGNELMETHYVYNLVLNAEGTESLGFVVISFTSTKIKPYKDWFTAMYTLKGRPPIFANRAVVRTIKQKNEHGTFYNFRIDPLRKSWAESLINPSTEASLLEEAKSFRDMVMSGMARADFDSQQAAQGEGGTGDGDVPF